jgi:hypothetical protein
MIRVTFFAALVALPQTALLSAPPCVTRQEAGNLLMLAAPAMIETAARKCGTSLPAGAFLSSNGERLAQRLRSEAPVDAVAVAAALAKFSGKQMPSGVSAETMQGLVRDVVAFEFAKDINPEDCGTIDEIVGALAPLPARNLGTLVIALLALGSGGKKTASFKICPLSPQP